MIGHQLGPWLDALGADKPRQFFIDSFELVGGLPWTPELATRYSARTGHRPAVDLPYLLRADGETKYIDITREHMAPAFASAEPLRGVRAREDYERVRAELFRENFIAPLSTAAQDRGVGLRVQAHGGWGVVLDDYAGVPTPESESLYAGGSFDFLTLAASAAHVAGARIASAESFVTLNLIEQPYDLDSLWLFAGQSFTAGINWLVHGVAVYPYVLSDGTQWDPIDPNPDLPGRFTSKIEPGAPTWSFLPAFNRAQARITYALSRGAPRTDIAWLWSAREHRDHAQLAVGPIGAVAAESPDSAALRAAGFSYDRVSPRALAQSHASGGVLHVGAASYRALVLSDGQVIDPEVLARVEAAVAAGVPVVWVGDAPARAFGAVDATTRDASVRATWSAVMTGVSREASFAAVPGALIARGVEPEIEAPSLLATLGISRREVASGQLVWIFNPSLVSQLVPVRVRVPVARASWLDPETGAQTPIAIEDQTAFVSLPAARGGILYLEH